MTAVLLSRNAATGAAAARQKATNAKQANENKKKEEAVNEKETTAIFPCVTCTLCTSRYLLKRTTNFVALL